MSYSTSYLVVHSQPGVVFCMNPWDAETSKQLSKLPPSSSILAAANWHIDENRFRMIADWAIEYRRRNPTHRIEFIADTHEMLQKYRAQGEAATLVHHNALCDEAIFCVHDDTKKHFPAVCVATPAPYKRLWLCEEIRGQWLWLFYLHPNQPWQEELRETLNQNVFAPQWSNGSFTGRLTGKKISRWLNQAKAGLCLSEIEGGQYAATEYGLCGLPVVTTVPTRCTRGTIIPEVCAVEVDPTRRAVADGVLRACEIAEQISPPEIRRLNLELLKPHRLNFVAALQRAYAHAGLARDVQQDLFHLQCDKFLMWQEVEQISAGGERENRRLLENAANQTTDQKIWPPKISESLK